MTPTTAKNIIVTNNNIHSLMFEKSDKIMELILFAETEELQQLYRASADKHNSNMVLNTFPDAGFDLVTPMNYPCLVNLVTKINFQVKCSARIICDNGRKYNTGFYMYPQSGLSNTKLRFANSVVFFDSGYRGNLIGAFDCLSYNEEYTVLKYDKLLQICAPNLIPIYVRVVDSEELLDVITTR